jgi:hypothetical protein
MLFGYSTLSRMKKIMYFKTDQDGLRFHSTSLFYNCFRHTPQGPKSVQFLNKIQKISFTSSKKNIVKVVYLFPAVYLFQFFQALYRKKRIQHETSISIKTATFFAAVKIGSTPPPPPPFTLTAIMDISPLPYLYPLMSIY